MLMRAALFLLAALLAIASGCAPVEDPRWYKPGGNYTTAEFNRDREACTKRKVFDPECMKGKGWVQVSPDRPAPTPPPPPRPRY